MKSLIKNHFVTNIRPVAYTISEQRTGRHKFLPDWSLVEEIKTETDILSDNALLIHTLEIAEQIVRQDIVDDLHTWSGMKYSGSDMHIADYYMDYFELYLLYLCYCRLVWEEDISSEKRCLKYLRDNFNAQSDNLDDQCWAYIWRGSDSITTQISFGGDDDTKTIHEYIHCPNKFNALQTQLFLHIAKGKTALEGRSVDTCSRCGEKFIKEHGNKKYCALCASVAGRSKAYRTRKKEAKQNAAKENNP